MKPYALGWWRLDVPLDKRWVAAYARHARLELSKRSFGSLSAPDGGPSTLAHHAEAVAVLLRHRYQHLIFPSVQATGLRTHDWSALKIICTAAGITVHFAHEQNDSRSATSRFAIDTLFAVRELAYDSPSLTSAGR